MRLDGCGWLVLTDSLVPEDGVHVGLGADLVLQHLLVDAEMRVAREVVVRAVKQTRAAAESACSRPIRHVLHSTFTTTLTLVST